MAVGIASRSLPQPAHNAALASMAEMNRKVSRSSAYAAAASPHDIQTEHEHTPGVSAIPPLPLSRSRAPLQGLTGVAARRQVSISGMML